MARLIWKKMFSYRPYAGGVVPDATVDKEQRAEIAKRLTTPPGDDPEALFEGPLSVEDVYARILALQAKVRCEESPEAAAQHAHA